MTMGYVELFWSRASVCRLVFSLDHTARRGALSPPGKELETEAARFRREGVKVFVSQGGIGFQFQLTGGQPRLIFQVSITKPPRGGHDRLEMLLNGC